jgi:hypothetical protein
VAENKIVAKESAERLGREMKGCMVMVLIGWKAWVRKE